MTDEPADYATATIRGVLTDLQRIAGEPAEPAQLERDPSRDASEGQSLPEATGPTTGPQLLALEARVGDQRRAGVAFAEVIEQMRGLPGQSGFMRTPDLQELTAQAAHGPIVVLDVAELRSDAFLVTTAGVRALPLPVPASRSSAVPDRSNLPHNATLMLDAILAVAKGSPAGAANAMRSISFAGPFRVAIASLSIPAAAGRQPPPSPGACPQGLVPDAPGNASAGRRSPLPHHRPSCIPLPIGHAKTMLTFMQPSVSRK
jgi:hypothetical protein